MISSGKKGIEASQEEKSKCMQGLSSQAQGICALKDFSWESFAQENT